MILADEVNTLKYFELVLIDQTGVLCFDFWTVFSRRRFFVI